MKDYCTALTREVNEGNLHQICEKLNKIENELLESRAEANNVRQRTGKEIDKSKRFSVERFASDLLPVMDSLECALKDSSSTEKIKEAVGLTMRQLRAVFNRHKVLEINPVHQKFDPHFHQAISMVSSEEKENMVISVLQKGYVIWERLLRPALVVVSSGMEGLMNSEV
jgi:molecular chaperone GrpE